MSIEQHLPRLKTYQRLKEAGFPQETWFCWNKFGGLMAMDCNKRMDEDVAVPILTEILEQLPDIEFYQSRAINKFLIKKWLHQDWEGNLIGEGATSNWQDNPAEAAALLWLELKEQQS